MPVKVEQINEYLFSDTVQSQKTKSDSDEISQGYYLVCQVTQVRPPSTQNPFAIKSDSQSYSILHALRMFYITFKHECMTVRPVRWG